MHSLKRVIQAVTFKTIAALLLFAGSACSDDPVAPRIGTLQPTVADHAYVPPPSDIYADSNLVHSSQQMAGPYPKDVAWVWFDYGTSVAERDSALATVDGQVIGSLTIGQGGYYYVQVADDGTEGPLFEAIADLKTLPQVRFATPDLSLLLAANYRRPSDGASWTESDWSLTPSASSGQNWNLEEVNAPMGWGCSVGDSAGLVAIVDQGFHSVSDLAPNVEVTASAALGSRPANMMHGTQVASVVAARGDNQQGMAGLMWQARMRLYETGVAGVGNQIAAAAAEGASVINLSMGLYWTRNGGPGPSAIASDSLAASNVGNAMYLIVKDIVTHQSAPPLFVISASNDGIDAWWAGTPQVADSSDVSDYVLVVGGSNASGNLWSGSNRNVQRALVDVAAPAEDVATLTSASTPTVVAATGVSFAAPHATGVAGLLKSFDPRLTAPEVRDLILGGAQNGGRAAGGIPILDVYESLRLAATRSGAPLCGSRVWAEGATVKTQRAGGAETLFTVPDVSEVEELDVLHGGSRIQFDGRLFAWEASQGWSEQPYPEELWDSIGPSMLTTWLMSHDGDSYAMWQSDDTGIDVVLGDMQTWNESVVGRISLAAIASNNFSTTADCVIRRHTPDTITCADSIFVGAGEVWQPTAMAFSPLGDEVLVGASGNSESVSISSGWQICPGEDSSDEWYYACREFAVSHASTGGRVFAVSIASGAVREIPVTGAASIEELIMADGRVKEFSMQRIGGGGSSLIGYVDVPWSELPQRSGSTLSQSAYCSTEFADLLTGATLFSLPTCPEIGFTFSPSTATVGPRGLSAASPGRIRKGGVTGGEKH